MDVEGVAVEPRAVVIDLRAQFFGEHAVAQALGFQQLVVCRVRTGPRSGNLGQEPVRMRVSGFFMGPVSWTAMRARLPRS